MPSKRIWLGLALALSLPIAVGLFETGRLLFYSLVPVPEGRLERALHILAYQRVACADAYLADYAEGSITVQCRDRYATRYSVFGLEPCSETLGCRWFWMLCMYASKHRPRIDPPS